MVSSNEVSRRKTIKLIGGTGAVSSLTGCLGNLTGSDSGGPLKIGASSALTGKYSYPGKAIRDSIELWVNQLNEQGGALEGSEEGGLLGREVELVIYDDQSKPSRSINLYKRLISEDNVDLLIGPYSSSISQSVAPVINGNEMASILPGMSDPSVLQENDLPYLVQCQPQAGRLQNGVLRIALENGAETVGFAYEDTAFPAAVAEGTMAVAEELGLQVVADEPYPKSINDYNPIINKISEADPDVLIGGGYPPDAIGLTRAMKSQGFSPGIASFTNGGGDPALLDAVGASAEAISSEYLIGPKISVPHIDKLSNGLQNLKPEKYKSTADLSANNATAYSACLVMEKAVKNVGEIDQRAIADQLHSIEMGIPLANGKYKTNERGVQVGLEGAAGQWQENNGEFQFEAVYPPEGRSSKPIYPHPDW
jgi:branched-chain amino acid transport system substrate-binding protein